MKSNIFQFSEKFSPHNKHSLYINHSQKSKKTTESIQKMLESLEIDFELVIITKSHLTNREIIKSHHNETPIKSHLSSIEMCLLLTQFMK